MLVHHVVCILDKDKRTIHVHIHNMGNARVFGTVAVYCSTWREEGREGRREATQAKKEYPHKKGTSGILIQAALTQGHLYREHAQIRQKFGLLNQCDCSVPCSSTVLWASFWNSPRAMLTSYCPKAILCSTLVFLVKIFIFSKESTLFKKWQLPELLSSIYILYI